MTILKDMVAIRYRPYDSGHDLAAYTPRESLIPIDKAYDLITYEEEDAEGKLADGYVLAHTECGEECVVPKSDLYAEAVHHDNLESGWGTTYPWGELASCDEPEYEYEGILLTKSAW